MPDETTDLITDDGVTPETGDDNGKGGKNQVLADLAKERDKRQALEAQLEKLLPLQKIAEVLGSSETGPGPSDIERLTERLAGHERELATEREARWRAEVAHEKGLTPAQASRLRGTSREEFAADADDLIAAFPVAPPAPRTDPSQGVRPDSDAGGLAAGAAAYEARKQKKGPTYQ